MPRVLIASVLLVLSCEPGPKMVREAPAPGGPRKALRVVTFNLYNRPWQRQARMRAQVETLAPLAPDLVALQEVAHGAFLAGDPAELLATELGLGGARVWHEQNLGLFRTGLGLLSRWPLRDVTYREFARSPFWDAKGFLAATVQTAAGELAVIDVHLASGDREIRASELEELELHARRLAKRAPVLVLGDFNAEPEELGRFVRRLGAETLPLGGPTWNESYEDDCGAAGGEQIDHLLLIPGPASRLRFLGGGVVAPRTDPHPSDHCPVAADLELVPLGSLGGLDRILDLALHPAF